MNTVEDILAYMYMYKSGMRQVLENENHLNFYLQLKDSQTEMSSTQKHSKGPFE